MWEYDYLRINGVCILCSGNGNDRLLYCKWNNWSRRHYDRVPCLNRQHKYMIPACIPYRRIWDMFLNLKMTTKNYLTKNSRLPLLLFWLLDKLLLHQEPITCSLFGFLHLGNTCIFRFLGRWCIVGIFEVCILTFGKKFQ